MHATGDRLGAASAWYDVGVAWDSRRPVPWRRLLLLFAVYAVIATLAIAAFGGGFRVGTFLGMAVGFALYLGGAFVLVKFGWNPPALRPREAAREAAERRSATAAAKPTEARPASRGKPAPTSRTNATNRRAGTTNRRR